MRTIARFTTRPIGDNKNDLILGKMLDPLSIIKPNHVYEIIECLGELTITDMGESSMGMGVKDCMLSNVCWCQECGDIVADGSHLYTKDEASKIIERRKNGE